MFAMKRIFAKTARTAAAGVLAVAALFAFALPQASADGWKELKLIVDHSAEHPYFSFRCYSETGRSVGSWRKNLPKGIHYKCSGHGDKAPAYARVHFKDLFFSNAGPRVDVYGCTHTKRSCGRIVRKRGKYDTIVECSRSC